MLGQSRAMVALGGTTRPLAEEEGAVDVLVLMGVAVLEGVDVGVEGVECLLACLIYVFRDIEVSTHFEFLEPRTAPMTMAAMTARPSNEARSNVVFRRPNTVWGLLLGPSANAYVDLSTLGVSHPAGTCHGAADFVQLLGAGGERLTARCFHSSWRTVTFRSIINERSLYKNTQN